MAEAWYVQKGSERHGPMPLAQLQEMFRGGGFSLADLVWAEGWPQWRPAGSVAELQAAQPEPAARPGAAQAFAPPGQAVIGYRGVAQSLPATGVALGALAETRPWVLFLSILGFIFIGLFALVILGMLVFGLAAGGARGGALMLVGSLFYGAVLLLYFFPVMFLFRYASAIGRLNQTHSPADLEAALIAQKSFWKFIGILTLIMVLIQVAIFAIALVVGALTAM